MIHSPQMATLQGPLICRLYHVQQARVTGSCVPPTTVSPLKKVKLPNTGFWGQHRGSIIIVEPHKRSWKYNYKVVQCSFGSSSDGGGSMAENFSENDEEYVNSSVIEAVEVRGGSDGVVIKMREGQHIRCVHNNPQDGHLPDYAPPHHAIVLKMEDGSDLLLPIVVLEMPSLLLLGAIRNVQIARPTIYQIVKEMIDKMGYMVQLVRVTKRVNEAYFGRLYLAKVGDESVKISLDLRPSDAINIAVRCKVPIQVNKQLAFNDGMRVVEPAKVIQNSLPHGSLFTELDKPDGQPCIEAKEFGLVRNMLVAYVEERYRDAAQWRDKLTQFRSNKNNWA